MLQSANFLIPETFLCPCALQRAIVVSVLWEQIARGVIGGADFPPYPTILFKSFLSPFPQSYGDAASIRGWGAVMENFARAKR